MKVYLPEKPLEADIIARVFNRVQRNRVSPFEGFA